MSNGMNWRRVHSEGRASTARKSLGPDLSARETPRTVPSNIIRRPIQLPPMERVKEA